MIWSQAVEHTGLSPHARRGCYTEFIHQCSPVIHSAHCPPKCKILLVLAWPLLISRNENVDGHWHGKLNNLQSILAPVAVQLSSSWRNFGDFTPGREESVRIVISVFIHFSLSTRSISKSWKSLPLIFIFFFNFLCTHLIIFFLQTTFITL